MIESFTIADLHFGHTNILEYEKRPFNDINEMDTTIIKNWNNTVHKKGITYILGDFSFYNFEKTKAIFDQLHGIKHLIMGNHDRSWSRTKWKKVGFDIVINNPIILYEEKVILSHEPFKGLFPEYKNIHGHIHMKKLEPDGHRYPFSGFADNSPNYINISADAINFTPVQIKDLL